MHRARRDAQSIDNWLPDVYTVLCAERYIPELVVNSGIANVKRSPSSINTGFAFNIGLCDTGVREDGFVSCNTERNRVNLIIALAKIIPITICFCANSSNTCYCRKRSEDGHRTKPIYIS